MYIYCYKLNPLSHTIAWTRITFDVPEVKIELYVLAGIELINRTFFQHCKLAKSRDGNPVLRRVEDNKYVLV